MTQQQKSFTEISLILESLIQHGFQKLRPFHLDVEDYCITLKARFLCAKACLKDLEQTLSISSTLSDSEIDTQILKASESCLHFLSGCLDSYGHLLNFCFKLELPEEKTSGKKSAVNLSIVVIEMMKSSQPNTKTKEFLKTYWNNSINKWDNSSVIRVFYFFRNRVTHRKLLLLITTRDVNNQARVILNYPEPNDSLRELDHQGKPELLPFIRTLVTEIDAFLSGALSALYQDILTKR